MPIGYCLTAYDAGPVEQEARF